MPDRWVVRLLPPVFFLLDIVAPSWAVCRAVGPAFERARAVQDQWDAEMEEVAVAAKAALCRCFQTLSFPPCSINFRRYSTLRPS